MNGAQSKGAPPRNSWSHNALNPSSAVSVQNNINISHINKHELSECTSLVLLNLCGACVKNHSGLGNSDHRITYLISFLRRQREISILLNKHRKLSLNEDHNRRGKYLLSTSTACVSLGHTDVLQWALCISSWGPGAARGAGWPSAGTDPSPAGKCPAPSTGSEEPPSYSPAFACKWRTVWRDKGFVKKEKKKCWKAKWIMND